MQYISIIVLILTIGGTLSREPCKQAGIWYDVVQEAKGVIECREQGIDVWLSYSEIDPKDVDCDGIALWMTGRARELGADMSLAWLGLFEYEGDYHMAVLLEGLTKHTIVLPSSGMWEMQPFVPLEVYEWQTGMTLVESFQIIVEE